MDSQDIWVIILFILATVLTIIFCRIIRTLYKIIDNDNEMIEKQAKIINLYSYTVNLQNNILKECEELIQMENEGDVE